MLIPAVMFMREMKQRTAYTLLLSRSGTAFSRLIRALTGDEYTHVSLGLGAGGEIIQLCAAAPAPSAARGPGA